MFKRKRSEENPDVFMGLVELHERNWGTETYPDKPRLSDILDAPVVAFWRSAERNEARHLVTLHDDLDQLNAYFEDMFLNQSTRKMDRRLDRIYFKRERINVKGLRLLFEKYQE